MKNKVIAWGIGALAVLVLLIMTSVTKSPVKPAADPGSRHEVNLALREIADQILKANEDFTTIIPPISQEAPGTYLIKLGTIVDYSALRPLVDRTLERHHIRQDYRISLLNCDNDEVVLGFLARTFDENKDVPCQAREQDTECYNIRLALIDQEEPIAGIPPAQPVKNLPWLFLGLAISFPFVWLFWKQKILPESEAMSENGWLKMSDHTSFHPTNQTLQIHDQTIELTFREAKLLQFFIAHQNQVMERERILEAVWEDEGIIVGRSLDVFVSRLRKKLKADEGVQIANVHGVGYKLVV